MIRKTRAILCISILLLILCGCTSGQNSLDELSRDSKPAESMDSDIEKIPEEKNETSIFQEDYDELWQLLDDNYPFFSVYESLGIDIEQVRVAYGEMVENRATDLHSFVEVLKQMFRELDYFAHLNVVDYGTYQTYCDAMTNPASNRSDSVAWNEVLFNAKTVAAYEMLKTISSGMQVDYPEIETAWYPEINTAYFHIRTMAGAVVERDQEMIESYLSGLEHVENVIIDITGNSGGSTRYMQEVIINPFGGTYSYKDYIFLGKTPVNEKYYWDEMGMPSPVSELPQDAPNPSFLEEFGMDYFCESGVRIEGKPQTEEWMTASRWVLIDEMVYSSADTFARFCKKTGWATLVGRVTKGDGDGQGPVFVSLSNTGLLIQFSSTTGINLDGSCNTVYGTAPDILAAKGKWPLELCKETILKLKNQ